jgi:hypothetical protein
MRQTRGSEKDIRMGMPNTERISQLNAGAASSRINKIKTSGKIATFPVETKRFSNSELTSCALLRATAERYLKAKDATLKFWNYEGECQICYQTFNFEKLIVDSMSIQNPQ